MKDAYLMNCRYSTLEEFQAAYPWGSKWEVDSTPQYKASRGRIVGWLWDRDSYGVVLDNKKWYTVRSYAPSLLRKKGKK